MMGYPGAGKTTTAKVIHQLTGATHLWADKIRRERYGRPSYAHSENLALYDHMNKLVDELLAAGNDVIFDTNFSFQADRDHLKEIAASHNAKTLLVWVTTPKSIAKKRATSDSHLQETRLLGDMDSHDFERLSQKLEKPAKDEKYVKVDGTKVTAEYIAKLLKND